jgi:hypothetical protein
MSEGLSRGQEGEMHTLSQGEIDGLLADQQRRETELSPELDAEVKYIRSLLSDVKKLHKIGFRTTNEPGVQRKWNDANMRFDQISDELHKKHRELWQQLINELNDVSLGKRESMS